MLIPCDRHTPQDLDHWAICEKQDAAWARLKSYQRKVDTSLSVIEKWVRAGPSYAGASFGKDSTVLWDLVMRVQRVTGIVVPLVWVRVNPIFNPHCLLVRDALLAQYPDARYEEIEVWCTKDDAGWHATNTLERGFAQAVKRFGMRYMSGLRHDEGGVRKMRLAIHGYETKFTCAPLAWWSGKEIFAHLYAAGLPVHPAYAMTRGGMWDRERIRVASIGGKRGVGFGGRAEWEHTYYQRELEEVWGPLAHIDGTL